MLGSERQPPVLSGRTFLITGATGRLGCALTERLEQLGASVIPLVLEGYPERPRRVPWSARTLPLCVNPDTVLSKMSTPHCAINLHWRVHRHLPAADQLRFEILHNIERLRFLWLWLRDTSVHRFINTSSLKIYGSAHGAQQVRSTTPALPDSPYGHAKVAGETFFNEFFATLPVAHLRLSSVASAGEHESHLMTRLYQSAYFGKKLTINAGHETSLIYIDDVIDLIIEAALGADRRCYNLAAPPQRNEEIARIFERISKRTLNAEYRDLAPGLREPQFESDIPLLARPWTRSTPLREMVRRISRAYHDRPPATT